MLWPFVQEWDLDLVGGDPLLFPGYGAKLADLAAGSDRSSGHESVRTGLIDARGVGAVMIAGDFDVIGGSMGMVHGEKVVRAYDRAIEQGLPVVVVTRSGGARMQEGMVSLVQLARTAAAARRHSRAGLISVAVMMSPTTGGVLASYGSLTDLRVAEAGATVGFAGPRVAETVTGEAVGERSHTAESALAAGLVDAVVEATGLTDWVENALGARTRPLVAPALAATPIVVGQESSEATGRSKPSAWDQVLAARAVGRPSGVHVAAALVSGWHELGEGIDPTLRVGLADIDGRRVLVVASDRTARSGRPTPEGYRLVRRGIALAGRLGLPVVSLVDMPGAEPGADAENGGIAGELARTFADLSELPTPTVSVCVGEGGSGGALALAATDVVLMQETAVFSVIGPEGAAVILERDATRAPEVAPLLKLTSSDLIELGIIDGVVPDSVAATVSAVRGALADLVVAGPAGRRRLERWDQATARWLRDQPVTRGTMNA